MDLRSRAERVFRRLEPAGGDDARAVMDAARALDVGEFDLFRLAWRHQHGAEAPTELIERAYGPYMLYHRVPPWVRQFARDVLRLEGNGTLNPSKFGVSLVRRPPPPPPRHARLMVVGVAAAACLFVGLLIAAPNDPVNGPGLCTGGPGAAYLESTARAFTGKADPFACQDRR